jgi:hypothetical protein
VWNKGQVDEFCYNEVIDEKSLQVTVMKFGEWNKYWVRLHEGEIAVFC